MKKKRRLGNDPLAWIGQSTIESSSNSTRQEKETGLPNEVSNVEDPSTLRKQKRRITGVQVPPAKAIKSLGEEWTRKTYQTRQKYHDKIEAIAYWERRDIREVMTTILESYLDSYKVKPLPEKRKKKSD